MMKPYPRLRWPVAASMRHVGSLIDQCRAAGLTIDVDIDAALAPGSPMADLAAFRLVQEALTNTMRHAPGAKALVRVRRRGQLLELLAVDDGPAMPSGPATSGTGRGLIGMRERITLAGGQLIEAGYDGTGFRVHALIPAAESPVGSQSS
jgi:signal transduction histidine kinase